MKTSRITAVILRLILSISLFVITAAGIGAFYYLNTTLTNVAGDVSRTVVEANASRDTLQTLQVIQTELNNKQDIVNRAGQIVANSQSYQYQNQIINDVNRYAARAGLTVTNINFDDTSSKAAAAGAAVPQTSELKTATISVTLKNPVNFVNLLRFMKSIKQNLTKMQVARIGLSQDETGVSSDVLSITVFIK